MTKQPSYRFVRYTEAWEQRKLGEVAQYRNGKAHENCIDENGKYIVVNSKFISTDGEVKKFSNKKNEALFENEIAFVLSDVPNGRAIARTFWVEKNDKYTLNQRIAGITPIGETFPYFLYILMNRHPYFLAFDDGAKQTNLSVSDVMGFEAYYPKYSEQQKIGAYFRNLDHLITLQQRKLEVLKEQKKTYLKLLFPAKGQTKPALRFAGFEDEWKEVKLGEAYSFSQGQQVPVEEQFEQINENRIRFIRIVDLTNKGEEMRYIEFKSSTGRVYEKDIFFVRYGAVGVVGIGYDGIIANNLFRLNPQMSVDNKFMYVQFNREKFKKTLQGFSASTTMPAISFTDIRTIDIYLPSLPEQTAIGSFFQELDKVIAKQEEKVNQLKESKQTLLRKMFI
ncbi:restriction endonuclease subunit S [Streptococcus thalassemiae]|nr:restriction endonuclease subunit S [Streptococcus thalassemiae]